MFPYPQLKSNSTKPIRTSSAMSSTTLKCTQAKRSAAPSATTYLWRDNDNWIRGGKKIIKHKKINIQGYHFMIFHFSFSLTIKFHLFLRMWVWKRLTALFVLQTSQPPNKSFGQMKWQDLKITRSLLLTQRSREFLPKVTLYMYLRRQYIDN